MANAGRSLVLRRGWLSVSALCLAAPATAGPMFLGLGDLPGGDYYSQAAGISADGSTVVGYSRSAQGVEAFRWTASGGMVGLGDLPGGDLQSFANAVSGDGSVIVGSGQSSSGQRAIRWTQSGGMVPLSDLSSNAFGVSGDGSVVVGAFGFEAFRWTESTGTVGLGDLPGGEFSSAALAASDDGAFVVGRGAPSTPFATEAFRWNAGTGMIGLGDLPGGYYRSDARDVSDDGSVVVGSSNVPGDFDTRHAFRWTESDGMQDLGTLPGSFRNPAYSFAHAVSADGSIIVGTASSPSSHEAFIWDAVNGMRELDQVLTALGVDLGDWTLTHATGISADGTTIVGLGSHPFGGAREAWIAVIPEPSTGLLMMIGLSALAYRQKRYGRAREARPPAAP